MVSLEVEAWAWYVVALCIVFARFFARCLQLKSLKKFHAEDWVMAVVTIFYTADIILLIKASVTPTNLIPDDELPSLTDEDKSLRIYGSKLILAVEQFFIATQWGCKACLLLLYYSLTSGLRQNKAVKIVAVYTALSYVVMNVLYLGVWCRPFHNYWSVPAASPQCSTAINHLITNLIVNVSSDICILLIPLPMLAKTKLPVRKKAVLCGLFSVGIFVILSAVLNKYYSFTEPYGSMWVYWYVREISTAVIVANLPHAWALVRRMFNLNSFIATSENALSGHRVYYTGRGGAGNRTNVTSRNSRHGSKHGMNMQEWGGHRGMGRGRFMERLPSDADSVEVLGSRPRDMPLEIWEVKQVEYKEEEAFGKDVEAGEGSRTVSREAVGDERRGEITTVCRAALRRERSNS